MFILNWKGCLPILSWLVEECFFVCTYYCLEKKRIYPPQNVPNLSNLSTFLISRKNIMIKRKQYDKAQLPNLDTPDCCRYCWNELTITRRGKSVGSKQRRYCKRCKKTRTHWWRKIFSADEKWSAILMAKSISYRRSAKLYWVSVNTIRKRVKQEEATQKAILNMYSGWLRLN